MTKKTRETASFEYAGQEWSVPVKMTFTEMESMQDALAAGGIPDVAMVRILLDDAQLKRFRELNLDESDVDSFTDAMAKAKRLGSKGNSSASSASS